MSADARTIASSNHATKIDPAEYNRQLELDMAELYDDPLGFAAYAYPWGEGDLDGQSGLDSWQRGFCLEWGQEIRLRNFDGKTPVMPQMFSTLSGHGVGKSMLVAVICDFIPSTRPFCRGRVTANTSPQLNSTTWTEIVKWTRRCITGHWWRITSGPGSMMKAHRRFPEEWFVKGIAWRENSPEAFAGQHAPSSTSFYVMDEASAIAQSIVDTAKGGMTDGEPMLFMFGNGTKNSGPFYNTHRDAKERVHYKHFHVDSRLAKMANHKLHESWIEQYGIDSDFVRVRVLGQFPKQSAAQFQPSDTVQEARKREPVASPTESLILGVDVARFGDDDIRMTYRRGRDARSIPSIRLERMDAVALAHRIAEEWRARRPDAIMVDGGGVGGPVVDILRAMKIPGVHEINFGTRLKGHYAFMNGYMAGKRRDWLREGGCIEDSDQLETELISREYWLIGENQIMLEPKEAMKDRGIGSPDWADSLDLTFAMDIGPREMSDTAFEMRGGREEPATEHGYGGW